MKLLAGIALVGAVLTATATAATTLTIAASSPSVPYGKTVTLTGALSTLKANQPVSIVAKDCMNATNKVATVKTTANGAYTATITPTVGASYQASQKRITSTSVPIAVKPLVVLKRVKRGSFTATFTAALDFKGKALLFQRYATARKRWVQVKKVTLTKSVPGMAKPTIISSAAFKARLARRARVRLALTKTNGAPCYVAVNSNSVRN
jgi:hypothetical protein